MRTRDAPRIDRRDEILGFRDQFENAAPVLLWNRAIHFRIQSYDEVLEKMLLRLEGVSKVMEWGALGGERADCCSVTM